MPHQATYDYYFGGVQTVIVFSQAEMAEMLGLEVDEFIRQLESGEYGYCYHAHPLATGGEYEFTKECVDRNLLPLEARRKNTSIE